MNLAVMAFCRGAGRAGLLMALCGRVLLYGAALAAFRNAWLDLSFPSAAMNRPIEINRAVEGSYPGE